MVEDLVLFHLTKFGKYIFIFLSFPEQLKWRDELLIFGWHDLKFRRNVFETVK